MYVSDGLTEEEEEEEEEEEVLLHKQSLDSSVSLTGPCWQKHEAHGPWPPPELFITVMKPWCVCVCVHVYVCTVRAR